MIVIIPAIWKNERKVPCIQQPAVWFLNDIIIKRAGIISLNARITANLWYVYCIVGWTLKMHIVATARRHETIDKQQAVVTKGDTGWSLSIEDIADLFQMYLSSTSTSFSIWTRHNICVHKYVSMSVSLTFFIYFPVHQYPIPLTFILPIYIVVEIALLWGFSSAAVPHKHRNYVWEGGILDFTTEKSPWIFFFFFFFDFGWIYLLSDLIC